MEELVRDTGFSLQDWREKSRNREVCGILGCLGKPVVMCPHCLNWYCDAHKFVLDTPGHPQPKKKK